MSRLENCDLIELFTNNFYDFPDIPCVSSKISVDSWVDFDSFRKNRCRSSAEGLHFFEDDYLFNSLWNFPKRYIEPLKRFKAVVMPDFSLYWNYPVAVQIYNKYRNHWLSCWFSSNGIQVIPNIRLGLPHNHNWSILGYPKHSVVAFSDIGLCKGSLYSDYVLENFQKMLNVLEPIQVLYFTRSLSSAPSGVYVINVPYLKFER